MLEIKPKEKVSEFEDAGTLISRLGDYEFLSEFKKLLRMGSNSKVWFFVNFNGVQFIGQCLKLNSTWKVTVFDNLIGETSMTPIAIFNASNRFDLEELMYSLYFNLSNFFEQKYNKK